MPTPTPTPVPTPVPAPPPAPNPAAEALGLEIVTPTASTDFTAGAIDVKVHVTTPNSAAKLARVAVFYDGVELKSRTGEEADFLLAGWNPHVVNSVESRDMRPVPNGSHVLRAEATSAFGTVTAQELTFTKPFVFRGWTTSIVRDGVTRTLPDLPSARANVGLVMAQSRLFSFFGETAATSLLGELRMLPLDPFVASWASRGATGLTARRGAGVVAVGEKVYVIGGEVAQPAGPAAPTDEVVAYDVFDDLLDLTPPPLPLPLADMAAARLGNFLYVVGGTTDAGADPAGAQTQAYRLQLDADGNAVGTEWQVLANVSDTQGRLNATLVPFDGRLYLLGGTKITGDKVERILRYNPAEDSWSAEGFLPTAVSHAAGVAFNGAIWLFGGDLGQAKASRQAVRFDPVSRAIKVLGDEATLPSERAGMGIAVVDGAIFVVGGYGYNQAGGRTFSAQVLRADTL